MTHTFVCKTCKEQETYIISHKQTKPRMYCRPCADKRQRKMIQISNRNYVHISNGKPQGRPKKISMIEPPIDLKNVFTYDGSNELGY